MTFDRVDGVLPSRLNRLKTYKPVDTSAVCKAVDHALGGLWQHAVPMRAIQFRAGKVTVAVISAAWGNEIAQKMPRIKDAANKQLDGKPVKEITTRIAPEQAERQQD
jgi:hypothetical protein